MSVWVARAANGSVVPGGRFRQYEAFSNCDLDPLHVSSYHAIPYATFFPVRFDVDDRRTVSITALLTPLLCLTAGLGGQHHPYGLGSVPGVVRYGP